jgi:hypothetical protein
LEDCIMKKYLITTIAILVALLIAWPVLAQRQGSGGGQGQQGQGQGGGGRMQGLSEEERAQMREKMQNMSEEERQQFRDQMRARMGAGGGRMMSRMSNEEQLQAIKTIEEQVAKLKAGIEAQASRPAQSMQDMSEEDRTKLREQMRTMRQEQQTAMRSIVAQIAALQGQRQPAAEGEEFIIINTGQLKAIQALAVKEKAKETSDSITALLTPPQRGGGRGGRQGQTGQPGQDQPGERGNRQRPQQQQEAGPQGGGA